MKLSEVRQMFSYAGKVREYNRLYFASGLYVPGNSEKMLNKAMASNACFVVPDMEVADSLVTHTQDSVPKHEKEKARETIAARVIEFNQKLRQHQMLFPRPNACTEDWDHFAKDIGKVLESKEQAMAIDGFVLTMVSDAYELKHVNHLLRSYEEKLNLVPQQLKLIPQIETTRGLSNIKEILDATDRTIAVAFGADDFLTDFGIERPKDDRLELEYARQVIALEAAARGIVAVDSPNIDFKNEAGLRDELAYLKRIGIKAKFAIHPVSIAEFNPVQAQVDVINECFMPSAAEIKRATKLVEAFEAAMKEGKAAISFENKMVDIPGYKRAVRLLQNQTEL